MARRKGQDGTPSAKQGARSNSNGAILGVEVTLFLAADKTVQPSPKRLRIT